MITFITVNYNRKELLRNCLDSILALDCSKDNIEIIVVDNTSSDGLVEEIKQNYPYVKLISNPINNYCTANNLGIKEAKGDFLALINNDIVLDKNWLTEMLQIINNDSYIGAVTSKILFLDGKINSTGVIALPQFYWQDRGFKEEDVGQYDNVEEISYLSHCACLYRKEAIVKIGLLDEDFNMYLEDVDMSIRLRESGYKIYYNPKAVCYHHFHGSIENDLSEFWCERNRLLLIAKHYPYKLADMLYGKGYFTVLRDSKRSIDMLQIISDVLLKLFKTHRIELVEGILPQIMAGIREIMDLEKYYLLNKLDEKEKQIKDLLNKLSQINDKFEKINNELSLKDKIIKYKDSELTLLKAKIEEIYNSETYRIVAKPIWFLIDCFREIKQEFFYNFLFNFYKKYKLCLAYFSTQSNIIRLGQPNRYHIKITNDTDITSTVKLKIRISYNVTLCAYFIKILNITPKMSQDVYFEYDWQNLAYFCINDILYHPDEFWIKGFIHNGFYSIDAYLYSIKDEFFDQLTIYQKLT